MFADDKEKQLKCNLGKTKENVEQIKQTSAELSDSFCFPGRQKTPLCLRQRMQVSMCISQTQNPLTISKFSIFTDQTCLPSKVLVCLKARTCESDMPVSRDSRD